MDNSGRYHETVVESMSRWESSKVLLECVAEKRQFSGASNTVLTDLLNGSSRGPDVTVGAAIRASDSDKWTLRDLVGLRGIVRQVGGSWVQVEWIGDDAPITWLPIADLREE